MRTLLLTLDLRSVAPPVALLTNDGLPLPIGLCDLIGAAHLTEGHTADDEDHDTWPGAVLSRCLILVPVAIPSTARAERITGSRYCRFIAIISLSLHSNSFYPFSTTMFVYPEVKFPGTKSPHFELV